MYIIILQLISRFFTFFSTTFFFTGGAFLLRFLKRTLGPLIGYIASMFGMTAVVLLGLKAVMQSLKDFFLTVTGAVSFDVLSLLGMMNIDIAFTMVVSSATIKFVMAGWKKDLSIRRSSDFIT